MQETTPIFDALWEKYNATPIYDRVLLEHEHNKAVSLIREYITGETIKRYYEILEYEALFGKHPDIKTPPQEKPLMNTWQALVNEFREAMDLPVPEGPRQLTADEAEMHIQMIRDEFEKELVPALRSNDMIELYDAGIDVIVYVIGALSNAGFDLDPGFKEVMRSNMTKMDPVTGKAIRSRGEEFDGEPFGKVLKGPAYEPPRLGPIVNDMSRFGHEDNTVYRGKKIPLTLGIGGPKIGEGDIRIDHNGNMSFQGEMDVDVSLPIIDHLGYDVSAISVGPDLGQDIIDYNDFSYIGADGQVRSTADDRRESVFEQNRRYLKEQHPAFVTPDDKIDIPIFEERLATLADQPGIVVNNVREVRTVPIGEDVIEAEIIEEDENNG